MSEDPLHPPALQIPDAKRQALTIRVVKLQIVKLQTGQRTLQTLIGWTVPAREGGQEAAEHQRPLRSQDFSQADRPNSQYKSVNFGAGNSLGPPNRRARISL